MLFVPKYIKRNAPVSYDRNSFVFLVFLWDRGEYSRLCTAEATQSIREFWVEPIKHNSVLHTLLLENDYNYQYYCDSFLRRTVQVLYMWNLSDITSNIHTLIHSLIKLSPSWEAANCATTLELPSILWNPKVHYRVQKSPPLVPILSEINLIHIIPSYFSKIHFNIVTHLRLGLPSGLFHSRFSTNILYAFLFSPIHGTCSAHLILLDLIILIILGEEYNLRSIRSPNICNCWLTDLIRFTFKLLFYIL
jgi:hypothetical protein